MAQDKKLPTPDERGRVRVWQVEEGRWLNLHPVDAREQLARGIVALDESGAAPDGLLPAAHLPEMTVKELGEYVADNELPVNLAEYRLKEEKVEAVQKAIAARNAESEG